MREEITAYKRERILEEAVKLFYVRGFSGTTLDDIAGKLDKGQGTAGKLLTDDKLYDNLNLANATQSIALRPMCWRNAVFSAKEFHTVIRNSQTFRLRRGRMC